MERKATARRGLQLPSAIIGANEIRRLQRELETIEDTLHQATLRSGHDAGPSAAAQVPAISRLLQNLVDVNKLTISQAGDRQKIRLFFDELLDKAPVITLGFAIDPSAVFVDKLVEWLRQNIHAQVLVRVGLQPDIAAGCILRTASKQYDLSLRQHFKDSRPLLVAKLHEAKA